MRPLKRARPRSPRESGSQDVGSTATRLLVLVFVLLAALLMGA